jgi:hypothetical protein
MEAKLAKDIIDFQKAAFDNTFSAISMMQDQAERATKMLLETSMVPVPEEGRKIMDEWTEAFKRGRDEFKKAVDESYRNMEDSFLRRSEEMEGRRGSTRGEETEAEESEGGEGSKGQRPQGRRQAKSKEEGRSQPR